MDKGKRHATTVYLDAEIARAMKVKAALSDRSVSDLVNDALAESLRRDHEHLRIIRRRRQGPFRPLEEVLKDLKRDGLL